MEKAAKTHKVVQELIALIKANHWEDKFNTAIQNAIVVDHVPAPVGSRRYFYACAAAYQSLVPFHSEYNSLVGQMNGLKTGPVADTSLDYCLDLVALAANSTFSRTLQWS